MVGEKCLFVNLRGKWARKNKAEIERAVGMALRKLGWKKQIWVSIEEES